MEPQLEYAIKRIVELEKLLLVGVVKYTVLSFNTVYITLSKSV